MYDATVKSLWKGCACDVAVRRLSGGCEEAYAAVKRLSGCREKVMPCEEAVKRL
jgi:hypothetical protein